MVQKKLQDQWLIIQKKNNLISVAGGGDTFAAIKKSNLLSDFSYISTAGGAFLEWLEGKVLPGLKVLENNFVLE